LGLLLAGGVWWLNDAGNQKAFSGEQKIATEIPSVQSTNEKRVNQEQQTLTVPKDQSSETNNVVNERNETYGSILPGSGASVSNRKVKNENTNTGKPSHVKKTKRFDNVTAVHQGFDAKQEYVTTTDNNVTGEANEQLILFQPDKKIQLQNEYNSILIITECGYKLENAPRKGNC
jgi:hypothetical protein